MFNILDSTDSTNNYAMAVVHAGMAKHGMAWFAREQTSGKGQQGRHWESQPGQNLALSIALIPVDVYQQRPFLFNAVISNACYSFFSEYAGDEVSIKWPNDIYWRDRKAGGVLIENKLMGNNWKWAIVGIGLNINQEVFSKRLVNPVSLKQISGRPYDPLVLAKKLHEKIIRAVDAVAEKDIAGIMAGYNGHLYMKGSPVKLKKGNIVFETTVTGVNDYGQLVTKDAVERVFNFGEVAWVL